MTTEQLEFGSAYARTTDPGTSHAAAQSMQGSEASRTERLVLQALILQPEGLTTHEMVPLIHMPYESVTPRIAPLVRQGLVVDSGIRRTGRSRRKCIVWRATT